MTQSFETTAQADRPPRLTLQGFADSVQREAFDVDRGLLGTWLQLWRRPGTTLRGYIIGASHGSRRRCVTRLSASP